MLTPVDVRTVSAGGADFRLRRRFGGLAVALAKAVRRPAPGRAQARPSDRLRLAIFVACAFGLVPGPAAAQPAPARAWKGSFGAGLALTKGNSDTSTINLSYEARRDDGGAFRFASKGLLIRGDSEGQLTTNRSSAEARLDREFGERTSLFTQVRYLRDRFKAIDYLVAPTGGVSHKLVLRPESELSVNVGVGGVWEKNTGQDLEPDVALTAGQQYRRRLSDTAEFTQELTALLKVQDFANGLYTFSAGLAASVTSRTQLKLELVDTFKHKPSGTRVTKHDVSILVSFVFKY